MAALALSGMMSSGPVAAGDFRVDSKVFSGDKAEPAAVNLTIFVDGMIYDFLEDPAEITILDKTQQKFFLLDPKRRVRTEIPLDDVATLNANLKRWAGKQGDSFLKFLGNPQFEQKVDSQSGRITFESRWITYRVTTTAGKGDTAKQYRDFSDWFVQLNTRLNPGYKLAFARMAVSEALEKRNEVPSEIRLSVRQRVGEKPQEARSVHVVAPTLTQADRDRVAQADQSMATFTLLKVDEYQKR